MSGLGKFFLTSYLESYGNFNEKSNKETTQGVIFRYDGSKFYGLIMNESQVDTFNSNIPLADASFKDLVKKANIELEETAGFLLNPLFKLTSDTAKHMDMLIKKGEADIKTGELLYEVATKMANGDDGESSDLSYILRLNAKIVPMSVNGNIINYYNIVSKAIQAINIFIKYYK